MKSLFRGILINSIALYLLPRLVPGVTIADSTTFIFGSIILTLLTIFLKPLLNIVSFPFSLLTFGLFSIVINAVILYLLTIFVSGINIMAFVYPGVEFLGFVIPKISFSTVFAFFAASIVLSAIISALRWLLE